MKWNITYFEAKAKSEIHEIYQQTSSWQKKPAGTHV